MFQMGAFQNPGFQQEEYSGGYGQGYVDAMNSAAAIRRLKDRIDRLPDKVSEPIKRAAKVDSQVERERILSESLEQVDLKLTRIYLDLMERLHNALVEQRIAQMQAEQKARADYLAWRAADEEETLLMILMNFDY